MTGPAALPQHSRRTPWALWTTLLALLLALQASAGTIRPASFLETGAVAAKLVLPAPLSGQFRDAGHAIKAAAQRLNAARPHEAQDGATPPLPAPVFAVAAPAAVRGPAYPADISAYRGHSAASPYRARAPPFSA